VGSDFTGEPKDWTTTHPPAARPVKKIQGNSERELGSREQFLSIYFGGFVTLTTSKELSESAVHRKSRSVLLTRKTVQLA